MKNHAFNSSERVIVSRRDGIPIIMRRALVIILALIIYTTLLRGLITDSQGFIAYTLLLLGYLYLETKTLWKRDPHQFWINPIVLATMFTFVMAFGITNILFFMPEDVLAMVGLQPIVTLWMNQLMFLVILGACAMWIGYSAGIGVGRRLQHSQILRKWLNTSLRVNKPMLYAFIAISLAARLLAIILGIYGYSSTYDQLIAAAAYREYLSLAESLGKLALVATAIQCFAPSCSDFLDRQLLWIVLCYEVTFGFLSGFKSAVVMPFIIVGIVYYSQRNRFPRWLVPAVVIAIIAAFAVIEPFRVARNEDAGFVTTSLSRIMETITSSYGTNTDSSIEGASTGLTFLARSNLTYAASLGIEYAANNELPAASPEFLGNIFLAPAHAIVPRLLWDTKPLENIGLWYTNEVMKLDFVSSTGMSPFTYLNFAGGPLAVILGFFTVGILQRGLFDGLRHFGTGGIIVLFGILSTLSNIPSEFNTFFVAIIRTLPLLIIAQYLLLQRPIREVIHFNKV